MRVFNRKYDSNVSFAARVFDSELRGLATKPFNLDYVHFLGALYRLERAIIVANTYFNKSKGY